MTTFRPHINTRLDPKSGQQLTTYTDPSDHEWSLAKGGSAEDHTKLRERILAYWSANSAEVLDGWVKFLIGQEALKGLHQVCHGGGKVVPQTTLAKVLRKEAIKL